MPRPEQKMVTLTIDGQEVEAPANAMLVDGAKFGDVEIPVFCYEPKLGNPVGACRMCLVEIEGIPKLQTACSTPIKDGMVVNTQTDRVKEAQQAVVEFLLINHPLDCPVCDKGGECPLQDITFGWGGGKSRFIEPKRHFQKPLHLSPLIAIDRERCILCYRCVRFSQEVSEDYQLVLLERGAHSYVATFDGHPYVAPFSGNIVELCPVGALTSQAYRFRARPWDIEGAGSICTLCPAQCNTTLTVRDDRVLRVLAREHDEVDDGWLCDKGRFAYQAVHVDERITQPMVRDGGELRPVAWDRALEEAAKAIEKARAGKGAAIAGDGATNEEAFLLARLFRDGLKSPNLDSGLGGARGLDAQRGLADPALQAQVSDLEFAHAVLVLDCEPVDDAPILDLRIRKGMRRNHVKLAVASSRASSLDSNAALSVRFAPGAGAAFAAALGAALAGSDFDALAAAAGAEADSVRALADLLRRAGEDSDSGKGEVVVLWGERLASGARAEQGARALLNLAAALELDDIAGAGLLEVPADANGRGHREAGMLPDGAAGYADPGETGLDAPGIARAAADGEISTLYLLGADPMRTHPDGALWDQAMERATAVIAHASLMSDTLRKHATVIFPAEAGAEKEGTLVHPDGRLQRLRAAIGHPEEVRPEWQVIAELAKRAGHDPGVLVSAQATAQLVDAVPFYAGLDLEAIGGGGTRWPERDEASSLPAPGTSAPYELEDPPAISSPNGALRLGTFRSIWASKEVEASPALAFLTPHQAVELAPADAQRLGLTNGESVTVTSNGSGVHATVALRGDAPEGTAFLQVATRADNANALPAGSLVEVRKA
jgi:NADH-quinone oxidoreductase subunit G